MRKISVIIFITLSLNICAQTNYFYDISGGTGFSTTHSEDAISGFVGIGKLDPPGNRFSAALTVSNQTFSITPSGSVLLVENVINSTIGPAGISPYSILAHRFDPNNVVSFGPYVSSPDFVVDQNGLVGIGAQPVLANNGNISAHFYLTDQNGDGFPLFASYTNGGTLGIMIDQNGLVGIGNYPGVGASAGPGIGQFAIPGNRNTNAHLYVTDPGSLIIVKVIKLRLAIRLLVLTLMALHMPHA